ncbi:MAG: DUF4298 domain-containing protein [Ruminococcaceae bacterium]|nr:DUF4298 domain-containing protein [Oscillospiraceae bacterium]
MKSTIDRIKNMEAVFDFLQKMVREKTVSVCKEDWFRIHLNNLLDYYENGLWLADYELDEKGMIPSDLKRGILSQDGFYDFLTEISDYL